MEKLVAAANAYLELVEGVPYRELLRSVPVLFLFLVGAGLFFSATAFIYVDIGGQDGAAFGLFFWLTLVLELTMLWAFRHADEARQRLRLQRIGRKFKTRFPDIQLAKRAALQHFFGRDESAYLAFSKEIAEALALQESLRGGKELDAVRMLRLIYDPDSKPRIYALLLVIVSGVTAMAIKSGADIDALFALLPQSLTEGTMIVVSWALILGLLLFAAYLLRVLVALTMRSFVMHLERKSHGELAIRCVQRDLLRHHRFIVLGRRGCPSPVDAGLAGRP